MSKSNKKLNFCHFSFKIPFPDYLQVKNTILTPEGAKWSAKFHFHRHMFPCLPSQRHHPNFSKD